jgi:hypothetical protein
MEVIFINNLLNLNLIIMKDSKKLSRNEMKLIIAGGGQLTTWLCQDYAGGPYISSACAIGNPITEFGPLHCNEYSCYNTGVSCPVSTGGCS